MVWATPLKDKRQHKIPKQILRGYIQSVGLPHIPTQKQQKSQQNVFDKRRQETEKSSLVPKLPQQILHCIRPIFMIRLLLRKWPLLLCLSTLNVDARMFERKSKIIHVESPGHHRPWLGPSHKTGQALKNLTRILARSPEGKIILEKARNKARKEGTSLSKILLPGEKSYTDITLIRKFSKTNPQNIQYKSLLKVFINRNLNVQDAVMDMAHELIHYTFRKTFNPYQKNFDLRSFITSTIEGQGGEVEAYMAECKVFFELFYKTHQGKTHCHLTLDLKTKKPDRNRTIKLFYRLGSHYRTFLQKMKKHKIQAPFMRYISPKHTLLISATYDLPYPIAAVHEYESILKKICENEYKRLNALPSRQVSSMVLEGYRHRCSRF